MNHLKLILILLGFVVYACNNPTPNNQTQTPNSPAEDVSIKLSNDKKTIASGENILLEIKNKQIFNWFKNKSGMCNEFSTQNENRNLYCSDPATFLKKTNFINIHPTQNKQYIAFEISSEEVSPDKVLGIYLTEQKQINWLTNYYLGNQFISFSPDESKFIYQSRCWEGLCGLTVKSIVGLANLKEINQPPNQDERTQHAIFSEWLDNNTINYSLKDHLGNSTDYTVRF